MRLANHKSIYRQLGTAIAITALLSSASFASAAGLAGSRVSKRHRMPQAPIARADPGGSAPHGSSGLGNSDGEMRSTGASSATIGFGKNAATLDAVSTTFGGPTVRTSSAMLRDCRLDSTLSASSTAHNQNTYVALGTDGMNGLQAEAGFTFRLR